MTGGYFVKRKLTEPSAAARDDVGAKAALGGERAAGAGGGDEMNDLGPCGLAALSFRARSSRRKPCLRDRPDGLD